MKVIIAGSREFDNYELLSKHCNIVDNQYGPITEVISGTARGADRLGEKWAKEHQIQIKQFPADWNTYGKSAGYRRNEVMAENADCLIAFDMRSKGIGHMINIAKERGLKCYIVHI